MIDEIVNHLKVYYNACEELHGKYPGILPHEFYENAKKAINENGPIAAGEFFKLLNFVKRDNEFPVEGLSFESMLQIFNTNKLEIEKRIELSKEEKDYFIYSTTKGEMNLYDVLINSLNRIRSSSELALMYYQAALDTVGGK